jgi:hypothetical protein
VEFRVDGKAVGQRRTDRVPAGPSRIRNRILLKQPVQLKPGPHDFEARITAAHGATVLDGAARYERTIR